MPAVHDHSAPVPFALRPFQNADADAVARLVTEGVRGHWSYAEAQFRESQDPARRRLVAAREEQIVATAHLYPFDPLTPDALRLDVAGDRVALTPLYRRLLADLPAGFSRLLGVTREDFSEQMELFQAAGFRNAWQSWGAHLQLSSFDFGRFRPLEECLFLEGYEAELLSPEAPLEVTGTCWRPCTPRGWPTPHATRPPSRPCCPGMSCMTSSAVRNAPSWCAGAVTSWP